MKICFLAPANNYHTKKWCKWFSEHGYEVHVVSFINEVIDNVTVHYVDAGVSPEGTDFNKIKYLLYSHRVKTIIDSIAPEIINVHYATSYGAVAALSGIRKYALSVWGSDVYDFPQKSILHKALLKFSLNRATILLSTSKAMASEIVKYTNHRIEITPFGVDMALFNPNKRNRLDKDNYFIVGTVKSLTDKYGIRIILEAIANIKNNTSIPVRLRIAGKGPQEKEYKEYAKGLGIDGITTWLGFISQEQAAIEFANMDVALFPSTSESFGVSAVEAQACETAVVISDVPGLKEATKPNVTSIVVKINDSQALADAIIALYEQENLRNDMASRGRKYVMQEYELNACFNNIVMLYNSLGEPE